MAEIEPRDLPLASALRALADDDARKGASADVERRLLAEVRLLARARRRRLYSMTLGVAAALLLAVLRTCLLYFASEMNRHD